MSDTVENTRIQEEVEVEVEAEVPASAPASGGEEVESADTKQRAARVHDVVEELSAAFPDVSKTKLKSIVDAIFKRIVPDLIAKHQSLKIVDFASIQLVMRKATRRKLPNGTRVVTPEHKALRFSPYSALEERLGMSDYKSVPEEAEATAEEPQEPATAPQEA